MCRMSPRRRAADRSTFSLRRRSSRSGPALPSAASIGYEQPPEPVRLDRPRHRSRACSSARRLEVQGDLDVERHPGDGPPDDAPSGHGLRHLEFRVPFEWAHGHALPAPRADLGSSPAHETGVRDAHPLRVPDDVGRVGPDIVRPDARSICSVFVLITGQPSSRLMTGNVPAIARCRRPKAASFSARTRSHRPGVDGRRAAVLPAQPEARPAIDRLEVGRRRDRSDARDGEAPADMVVRLPVDDLLERGEPAGHALGDRPDAAAAAGERLLDDDRPLPARPEGRRGQVRPDDRRIRRRRSRRGRRIGSDARRCRGGARRSRPASEPRDRA